jgi:hypothetical protein
MIGLAIEGSWVKAKGSWLAARIRAHHSSTDLSQLVDGALTISDSMRVIFEVLT